MTFVDYCIAFGTLRVEKPDGSFGYMPWEFWEGYNGEPGQLDVAEVIEFCQVFWTPKARQKGISEIWSLYAKYILEKEPGSQAKVFSAGSKQSKEFLEERFARKVYGCEEVYPDIPFPKWEIGRDRADCENGSYINIFSSDNAGARGGSQRLTLFDEAREYSDKDFKDMLQAIFPALRGRNQLAVVSSGKPGSAFNSRVKKLMKLPSSRSSIWKSEGIKNSTGMIFLNDFLDPEHRSQAWRDNELNQNFDGDKVRFGSEYPETIMDIFQSHEGLVIGSLGNHHFKPHEIIWGKGMENYIVYDDGHTKEHPALAWFVNYNRYLDFAYVYDEIYLEAKDFPVIAKELVEKIKFWRGRGFPKPECLGDVAGKGNGTKDIAWVMREETKLLGMELHFNGVIKSDKAGSLLLLQNRFFHGKILIDPKCTNSRHQLETWRYEEGTDKPSEKFDEAGDIGRYLCNRLTKGEVPKEPTYEELQQERIKEFRRNERVETPKGPSIDQAWMAVG